MKICYLSDANNPHTIKWCEYFRDQGNEISLISFSHGNIEGVKVFSLDKERFLRKNDLFKLSYLGKLFKVRKIIREVEPDILHAHYASSYGFFAAHIKHNTKIISAWGTDIYEFPKKSILHKKLLESNLRRVDVLFSTSNCMANEMKKYTSKDILITPFGVDLKKFHPQEKNSKEELVIGSVKTLNPKYGIDVLIRAFSQVQLQTKRRLKLLLVGKGEQKEELEQLVRKLEISESVSFTGFLSGKQLIEAYASMDLVVIPSYSESFGVAAIEAQAVGLPVIVSDAEGLLESTSPGETSLVFPAGNVDLLTRRIFEYIDNPLLMKKHGEKGRNFVEENFDIVDNFSKVKMIYMQLIKGKGSAN